MASPGELWEKLKEQEVVDPRLLIAFPILLVLGIGVLIYVNLGGDSGEAIAADEREFVCYFDQDVSVRLTNRELNAWKRDGKAIFPYDRRNEPPTRVRCPECDRIACIERDPATNELPVLSDEWVAILDGGGGGAPPNSRVQSP